MRCMLVFLVVLVSFEPAATTHKDDQTPADLEEAKTAFQAALASAREKLGDAIEDRLKVLAKSGNLSVVEQLAREKAAFETDERLPTFPQIKEYVAQYQKAADAACRTMANAYERAIKEYTVEADLEMAQATRDEYDTFLETHRDGEIRLSSLVPINGCKATPGVNGLVLACGSHDDRPQVVTKKHYRPPFALRSRVKTNSTNVRLWYNKGGVILNWDVRVRELRVRDLLGKKDELGFANKGFITPNEWHTVVWEIWPDSVRLLVDDREVYQATGKYASLESQVGIGPAWGSVVTLQSLSIKQPRE